jgi:hypothetical protein
LWRRPRPKLGCGAKERRKKIIKDAVYMYPLPNMVPALGRMGKSCGNFIYNRTAYQSVECISVNVSAAPQKVLSLNICKVQLRLILFPVSLRL